MAGHAQLKLVMTECSKTQIRLTRPIKSSASSSKVLVHVPQKSSSDKGDNRLKLESKPNLCADSSCKSLISDLLPTDLCPVEYVSVLATESSYLYEVHVFKQQRKEVILTVMILSFRTDSSGQTV